MEALNIVLAGEERVQPAEGAVTDSGVTVFELIRYAAQATYAPDRLVDALPGIRQAPLGIEGALNTLYNQGRHPGLVLLPDTSWTAQGLWVTRIRVLNQHRHAIELDNRLVQHTRDAHINGVGRHFIASMFYQRSLAPGEKTSLFVVTEQPLPSVIRF
jgi:hypothetical protein